MKIGHIVSVKKHPDADSLYVEEGIVNGFMKYLLYKIQKSLPYSHFFTL